MLYAYGAEAGREGQFKDRIREAGGGRRGAQLRLVRHFVTGSPSYEY